MELYASNKSIMTQTMTFCLGGEKTLWEMEKILVTSIFSISHNVFFLILLFRVVQGMASIVKAVKLSATGDKWINQISHCLETYIYIYIYLVEKETQGNL